MYSWNIYPYRYLEELKMRPLGALHNVTQDPSAPHPKRAMPKWTEIFLCWGFPLTNSYLSPGLSSPQLLVDDLIDRTGQGKNGVIRTSIFPKLCSTLVDWPLQQQFFPHLTQHIQSWSLIRVTIAMGEHRAGAWGVNKDQNRYVVQFGDTSLILSGEPRECSSQVSIGAGKLPRM